MNQIDELKLAEIKKKNTLASVAFFIAIFSVFLLVLVKGETVKIFYYGAEIISLIAIYVIVTYLIKKQFLYPYVLIVLTHLFMIMSVFLFGGYFSIIVILFFLLVISVVHLMRSVFFIGFLLGITGLILNTVFAGEEAVFLEDNLIETLLA